MDTLSGILIFNGQIKGYCPKIGANRSSSLDKLRLKFIDTLRAIFFSFMDNLGAIVQNSFSTEFMHTSRNILKWTT